MSIEKNKALVRHFFDEFNKGNIDEMMVGIAPEIVVHNLSPGMPIGAEGVRLLMTSLKNAFPDGQFSIEEMVAENDKVVSRLTNTGTNTGEFMGMPASGKPITISEIDIFRIENGLLAEHWSNADNLSLMQQLGIIPTPDQTPAQA